MNSFWEILWHMGLKEKYIHKGNQDAWLLSCPAHRRLPGPSFLSLQGMRACLADLTRRPPSPGLLLLPPGRRCLPAPPLTLKSRCLPGFRFGSLLTPHPSLDNLQRIHTLTLAIHTPAHFSRLSPVTAHFSLYSEKGKSCKPLKPPCFLVPQPDSLSMLLCLFPESLATLQTPIHPLRPRLSIPSLAGPSLAVSGWAGYLYVLFHSTYPDIH